MGNIINRNIEQTSALQQENINCESAPKDDSKIQIDQEDSYGK